MDWFNQAIERSGYFGIFLLMLAENLFPPIPSEVIMPLAGYVSARGQLTFAGVLLAGAAGSLAGDCSGTRSDDGSAVTASSASPPATVGG